jgi:hypothetical protein
VVLGVREGTVKMEVIPLCDGKCQYLDNVSVI